MRDTSIARAAPAPAQSPSHIGSLLILFRGLCFQLVCEDDLEFWSGGSDGLQVALAEHTRVAARHVQRLQGREVRLTGRISLTNRSGRMKWDRNGSRWSKKE